MLDGILDDILGDSPKRGEIRPDSPTVRPAERLDIPEFSPDSPLSPRLNVLSDDRHHCRECRHLSSSGYCIQQRFRPVDDIPRRCDDFTGYPDRISQSATSEATHNAQGRYFKFLATWKNGNQYYLCQMPRQTLDEMRAQFPDATHIEPVENEDYDDDNE